MCVIDEYLVFTGDSSIDDFVHAGQALRSGVSPFLLKMFSIVSLLCYSYPLKHSAVSEAHTYFDEKNPPWSMKASSLLRRSVNHRQKLSRLRILLVS